MKSNSLKFLALGGLTGPMLFTLTTLVCAGLRRGHSHISDMVGELGATGTPNAYLMNLAGFIFPGIMITYFGLSLILVLPKRMLIRTGAVLIIISGLGMVMLGCFSCDPGCPGEGSLENRIHEYAAGPAFLSAIIGSFVLGISFRKLPAWRKLWIYSVLSALFSLCFFIAMANSFESRTLTGMWERLLLLTLFLWMGIVAFHIFRFFEEKEAVAKT